MEKNEILEILKANCILVEGANHFTDSDLQCVAEEIEFKLKNKK
ncbi:hypothetical protein TM902_180057 [Tenacibaculum maritimum]|nr:hypothetical protein [Tenacibaculum maritimum]CAA0144779.1 hypothetical protein TM902_180057 [Tenacibaculum maritimum]CAA0193024.1 hypothetical protein USCSE301_250027 [Tenacibaculum maritimum]